MLTAGITVGSKSVTVVIGEVTDSEIRIQADETHNLHKGDRPAAYRMMRERLSQLLDTTKVEKVIIKGSAVGQRAASKACCCP